MGLSGLLARHAVAGAHVLVVESPGAWLTRVAVEQALVRRGWRQAMSPADADVLVVCGDPGPRLTDAVERVWEQLPGPRSRVAVVTTDEHAVDAALDDARRELLDGVRQRADAVQRPSVPPDTTGESHEGMDHGAMDHGAMDHGAMDHGGMDHGDMDMSGPGGIPLAGGARGRDGLEMDVLHLPVGPVLPHWPAGLVLWATMQGDVVTEVEMEQLGSGAEPPDQSRPRLQAARRCDDAGALLMLAGWDSAAGEAFRARDALLAGTPAQQVVEHLDRLCAKVSRSRWLRWSLRDLGVLDDELVEQHRLPEEVRGDVRARLLRLLAFAGEVLRGEQTVQSHALGDTAVLRHLVTGLDVGAVRLVVASLAPFVTHHAEAAPEAHQEGHHG